MNNIDNDQLRCMVVSMDNSKLFVSGGIEGSNYRPRIICVEFSNTLAKTAEIYLEQDTFSVIWCMERYPNSNILFAGSFGGVGIIFFNGSKFESLGVLKGKSDMDPFADMHFVGTTLYCIDEPSEILYKFDYTDPEQAKKQYRSKEPDSTKLNFMSKEYDRPTKETYILSGSLVLS